MNEKSDNKIINEMISTEKSYNASLTRLEKILNNQPSTSNNSLISDLKNQITVLKVISDQLVSNVESSLNNALTLEDQTKLTLQRTQLLKAFYTAYKPYAQIYNNYCIEVKKKPDAFNAFDAALTNSTKLKFADHLITPIQRGPRYALLVNTLLKSDGALDERLKTELVAIEGLIKDNLDTINSALTMPNTSAPGYQVGDLSRYVFGRFFGNGNATTAAPAVDNKAYQFGDYTRALVARLTAADEEAVRSELSIEFK